MPQLSSVTRAPCLPTPGPRLFWTLHSSLLRRTPPLLHHYTANGRCTWRYPTWTRRWRSRSCASHQVRRLLLACVLCLLACCACLLLAACCACLLLAACCACLMLAACCAYLLLAACCACLLLAACCAYLLLAACSLLAVGCVLCMLAAACFCAAVFCSCLCLFERVCGVVHVPVRPQFFTSCSTEPRAAVLHGLFVVLLHIAHSSTSAMASALCFSYRLLELQVCPPVALPCCCRGPGPVVRPAARG